MPDGFLAETKKDLCDTQEPVTETEIKGIIQKCNQNSATGADGVSYRMVQAVMTANPDIITELFDNLLRHSTFPQSWKQGRCVPIPKPGRTDISVPKNLRPISLLSCLGKTFEKVLTLRIARAEKETGAISD